MSPCLAPVHTPTHSFRAVLPGQASVSNHVGSRMTEERKTPGWPQLLQAYTLAHGGGGGK